MSQQSGPWSTSCESSVLSWDLSDNPVTGKSLWQSTTCHFLLPRTGTILIAGPQLSSPEPSVTWTCINQVPTGNNVVGFTFLDKISLSFLCWQNWTIKLSLVVVHVSKITISLPFSVKNNLWTECQWSGDLPVPNWRWYCLGDQLWHELSCSLRCRRKHRLCADQQQDGQSTPVPLGHCSR